MTTKRTGGQWFGAKWLVDLELLPDEVRPHMPETRPDEDAWHHRYGCRCQVCRRPDAAWWKRQKVTSATVPRAGPRSSRP